MRLHFIPDEVSGIPDEILGIPDEISSIPDEFFGIPDENIPLLHYPLIEEACGCDVRYARPTIRSIPYSISHCHFITLHLRNILIFDRSINTPDRHLKYPNFSFNISVYIIQFPGHWYHELFSPFLHPVSMTKII